MAKFIKTNQQRKISGWTKSAFKDNVLLAFVGIWFLPFIFSLAFAVFYYNAIPSQIPLFYSRLWGEQQLAQKFYLFVPIGGTLLLGIVNFGFSINFHAKDKVPSYLLAGAASLVSLLTAITIFNIINLIK